MSIDVHTTQNFLYSNYMAWFQLRQNLIEQNENLQSQIYQNLQKIADAENQQSNIFALANFQAIMLAQNHALYMQIDYNRYKIDELQSYLHNNYNMYRMNVESMNANKQCISVNGSVNNECCIHGSADYGSSDNGSSDNGSSDNGSSDNGSSDNGSSDNGSSDNGSADNANCDNGSSAIIPLANSLGNKEINKFDTNHLNANFEKSNHIHGEQFGQLTATKKRCLYQFKIASQTSAQWKLVQKQASNAYIHALYHKSMHAFETRMQHQAQLKNKADKFQACHEHQHIRASKLSCFHAMKCSMKSKKIVRRKLLNFRNQMRCKYLTKIFAQFGVEKEKCMQLEFAARKMILKNRLEKLLKKWSRATLENSQHEKFAMQWHKQQSKSKQLKKIFTCFKKYRNTVSINGDLVNLCKSRIKLQTLKFKCFFVLLTYAHSATKLHTQLHRSIFKWSALCHKYFCFNNHMRRRKIVMLYLCFRHLKHMLFKKYVQIWTVGAWKHFVQKAMSKYNMLMMCVKTQVAHHVMDNGMLNNLRQICPLCGICGYNSATDKWQFENFKWQFTSFADLRNEQLVDDLLYLHDQIRYNNHDIKFASNKLSNEKKTEILRQFETYPHVKEDSFVVGVHWGCCFNCDGIFSMTVRASVFNIPRQLSGINYLLQQSWQRRKYEIYERSQDGEHDLIVALSAHICDIGMKSHTPMHVLQNLETKKKTMLTKFPDFENQAAKRFPSLSCILAKMNEDDIGVHNEYLKYKTTFFRLAFTF